MNRKDELIDHGVKVLKVVYPFIILYIIYLLIMIGISLFGLKIAMNQF